MTEGQRYFFNFSFFKIDPKWRWMADLAKEESAKEMEIVMKNSPVKIRSYSTLGLRDDAEFMLWFASESIEKIQETISKMYLTVFGKYIIPSRVYLSTTRPSIYSDSGRIPSFIEGNQPKKYVIVYPFTKTREWYLLPKEQRQQMMDEHIQVGKRYPEIVLNTTYSFGIHDEDFMLAFETDNLADFQNLIMDLRETKVSLHVKIDTPMIVCVKKRHCSLDYQLRIVFMDALKEWATIIMALENGEQNVLLRKGGILEIASGFEIKNKKFLLFPTLEHQEEKHLKPNFQEYLTKLKQKKKSCKQGINQVSSYAEVLFDSDINDLKIISKLEPFHIWSEELVKSRLNWKPEKPIKVIFLKVYKIPEIEIPLKEDFQGCKSWININEEIPPGKPVLEESEIKKRFENFLEIVN